MAGAAGFEPASAGTKNRALTTWRRPSMGALGGALGRGAAYSGNAALEKAESGDPATALRRGGLKLGSGDRAAEMKTLQLGAAQLAHDFGLPFGLHPFGGGLHAKAT